MEVMEDPKFIAAVIAGLVSLVTAVISSVITFRVSEKKHQRESLLSG